MANLPDDFGYDAVRTLARVGDPTPARDHSVFWSEWFRALGSGRPDLAVREAGADASDPTATHEFRSIEGLRIGCRLLVPRGACRAGVVTCHGYEVAETLANGDGRWRALVERGVAVLSVRLRGYPGSQLDTGNLTDVRSGGGWFTHGLAEAGDPIEATRWVAPLGAADLANACRALRNAMFGRTEGMSIAVEGGRAPIYLHGESLGGGMAVIVAAQLVGRLRHEPIVERLAIGLPSLGDWSWRFAHRAAGIGEEVRALMEAHPALAETISQRVRLMDAAVHAVRVRGPVLGKLAERDGVVPAPSSAAVFNALGSDPGQKWRFVVPAGHADAGVANARRHALFERCLTDFFDPTRPVREAMEAWEPVLCGGERAPEPGASAAPASLFGADVLTRDRDAALIAAYQRAGRTLDSLPYTEEFAAIMGEVSGAFAGEREALHRLHTLRKAGRLPRLGRAGERPPTLEPEHERMLRALVEEAAGTMGARDRLPYTPEFDALGERFGRETGLSLGRHELWRVIAKLAK